MTKRILVVEDQEDLRGILRDLLTGSGYEVAEAADGGEGVAKQSEPPILDGYETTRQIKADPNLKATPIIAVSSYAMKGDEEKARASGCDHYVTKPYSPVQLLRIIREVSWRTGVGRTKSGLWVCFRGIHIGEATSALGQTRKIAVLRSHVSFTPERRRGVGPRDASGSGELIAGVQPPEPQFGPAIQRAKTHKRYGGTPCSNSPAVTSSVVRLQRQPPMR